MGDRLGGGASDVVLAVGNGYQYKLNDLVGEANNTTTRAHIQGIPHR
jgi:hypothetical protein